MNATLDQKPPIDRIAEKLDEMAACEGEMCSHCIKLLCEEIQPQFKHFQTAVLQNMTFEPDGAQFILDGPIRFVVKNGKLTNLDPLNFRPVGPLIVHGDMAIPALIDKLSRE
jgi:hypothetical protein